MKRPIGSRVRDLLRAPRPVVGAERPAEWYDDRFRATPQYHVPYQEAPYYFLWTVIVDRVRRDRSARVLEIGCGTGQLAAFLLDHGIDAYRGIDFSAKAIEYARKAAPSAQFIVDDARRSSIYSDYEHDVLICTEVLEHIGDDFVVVRKFRSRTRCILSVPSYDSAGHVRFFNDAGAVRERYGRYFDDLDVVGLPVPGSTGNRINKIFLADGRRNDFEARL